MLRRAYFMAFFWLLPVLISCSNPLGNNTAIQTNYLYQTPKVSLNNACGGNPTSFNLSSASTTTEVGAAAAGHAGDFWNATNQGNVANFTLSNILNVSSLPIPTTIQLSNLPGVWGLSTNGVGDAMYQIFRYSWGGNSDIYINNIQQGTYDIYLYGTGGGGSNFQLIYNGVPQSTRSTDSNAATSSGLATWVNGEQYVVFANFTVVACGDTLQIHITPNSVEPEFNGLQFVAH